LRLHPLETPVPESRSVPVSRGAGRVSLDVWCMEQSYWMCGAASACGPVTDHTNQQHRLTPYDNNSSIDSSLTTAIIMQPPMLGVSHRRRQIIHVWVKVCHLWLRAYNSNRLTSGTHKCYLCRLSYLGLCYDIQIHLPVLHTHKTLYSCLFCIEYHQYTSSSVTIY